jgi:hypothetical protein
MVRSEAAWKFRVCLPHARVVQMLLYRPLSDLGDLGVIDLVLVVDLVGGRCRPTYH